MRSEFDHGHFGIGDFDSRFVVFVDQIALHDEAGFRFGCAYEVEDFFDGGERFSRPVTANLAE